MLCEEIMKRNVQCVTARDSVQDAARRMRDSNVGFLPVCDDAGCRAVLSAALMLLPGPNIVAYYFAFRVMGHWLSMRGAVQGLRGIAWTGRPCEPLTELREVASLHGAAREKRVHEIAARLRLQHLSTFFERVAVRHA